MTRIEKLTAEQEARLPVFREEMRAKGLRLQWASDDEIRDVVQRLYQSAGLETPRVLVFSSPAMCLLARAALRSSGGQLGDQLRGQLWDQLRDQLRDQLWGQLGDQLGGQLGDQLRGQLWDQLRDQLGGQLRGQLWDQLRDQLRDQLWGQLGDQLFQSTWFAGGSENYWVAFYRFVEQIGVNFEKSEWLKVWEQYGETCGALYPYDGWAFVSRRPTVLSFNESRVLHSETGPAMGFEDGFEIHAWNGVRVPAEWVENTDHLDPTDVLKCENVEQRAAGVSLLGMERFLDKLEHEIIDSDPDPEHGDLISVRLPDLPNPGIYLRAQCPRNGRIMEAVNPREMDELTVRGAQAWRLGIPASEFSYPERRT